VSRLPVPASAAASLSFNEAELAADSSGSGKHPTVNPIIPTLCVPGILRPMKTKQMKRALTFGGLIENFYNAYGQRSANGILRLAVKAHLVAFHGRNRYDLSEGNGKT
jgi:hypothetical protein